MSERAKKYIDLRSKMVHGSDALNSPVLESAVQVVLRWLDEHPDQVPGRTITEHKLRQKLATVPPYADNGLWLRDVLNALGTPVVPDPPKSNAEKLKRDILRSDPDWDAEATVLAERLDALGWTKAGDA